MQTWTSTSRMGIAARGIVLVGVIALSAFGAPTSGASHREEAGSAWERIWFDSASGLSWASGIDDVVWVGGASTQRIPWVGDRFVAVGTIVPRVPEVLVDEARPAVWLSRDGRRWNEVPPESLPAGIGWLRAPVAFRGELYAFGVDPGGALTAARSSERGVWQISALADPTAERPYVDGAFVWDGQLVVYGSRGGDQPTAWRTRDGVAWASAPLPGSAASVVASPDGRRLVALIRVPNEPTRADVVFSSTDGVTWTKAARLGVSVDGGSETLGVWNGALWAVTYPSRARSGIGSSVLWRSRDGRTWRRAGAAPHDAIIDQLVSANGDLIATGVDGNEPGAWTSKDALRWTPMDVSRPAGGRLDRTATNGGSVVAFGTAPELRDFYRWERPRPRSGPRESDERVRRDPDAIPVPQVDVPGVQLDREEWRTQWASTPGSARRRCVPVEDHTEVRSGELIVGNFSSFVSGWDGTYETSKLYYIPLHPDVPAWPDDTKPLHVSAELLDGSLPRRVALDFSGFALSARGVLFYATGTVLPEAGTWRLRATAGRNEGCFLVTV